MNLEEGMHQSIHRVKVDTSGRIVLPADIRQRLGILEGDSILVVGTDDVIRIETAKAALAEAQEYFASFVPADVSLVDELIAERRAEAASE